MAAGSSDSALVQAEGQLGVRRPIADAADPRAEPPRRREPVEVGDLQQQVAAGHAPAGAHRGRDVECRTSRRTRRTR